jgi:general secretion pathway protein E
MKAAKQNNQQDHPLDLIQFLKGLYDAGRIGKEHLQKLVKARKPPKQHVLVFIANQEIGDLKNPGKILDLETLTQILAEQAKQEYYHVDPLSIDAAKVTDVMSHAFAKRHNIMAVKVDSNEVTIASAEPAISAWEEDLIQVLRKPIKRVVANPVELERLLAWRYLVVEATPTGLALATWNK